MLSHTGIPRPVIDKFENGVKPVVRLTLSDGRFLICTEEHPVRVNEQWVFARDVEVGDSVTTYGGVEQWKEVEGWPFDVSNWGRVRSHARGTILKTYKKGRWGHLKVCLFRNGAQKRGMDRRDFPVHRLVADAFVPNPDGLLEVRHLNGFSWDNTASNLVWGSREANALDAVAHGTMDRTQGSQAKLTWEQAAVIKTAPGSHKSIAIKYGIS